MAVYNVMNKRITNGSLVSNKKVVPVATDVPINSSVSDDPKSIISKNYKKEKFTSGQEAFENHDYVEAVKQFSLIKPDTTMSLYNCACARLELQYHFQMQEAIADFTKAIELSKQTGQSAIPIDVWYKRALAYHNISKYDDAINDYTEFIHKCRSLGERGKTSLPKGLIGRGQTHEALFELNMALKDINEANALTNNQDPYYLCCRANVYALKNERQKASKDLGNAEKANCDKNIQALLQRGTVLTEFGRYEAALADYKKAARLGGTYKEQSEIHFRIGQSEYVLNDKENALQSFERSIIFNPFHSQAYYRKGIIHIEQKQYKEALKALDRAQELSPEKGDILLERATVHHHLNKPDEAISDRNRGIKLNSTAFAVTSKLANRIKMLHEEINRAGSTSRNHLELATSYDGLLNQKKGFNGRIECYENAIIEYRAAIEADTKHLHPQASALLTLCHMKMNDLVLAHEAHLQFYNILQKHKDSVYHWKTYLVEIKDKLESGKLEPHLDAASVSKLVNMEMNRRKRKADEETFQYDTEDIHQNQLKFYQQLYLDLSNVLLSISILQFNKENIVHNVENASNRLAKIIELLIKGEISLPVIESILDSDKSVDTKNLQKLDNETAKMKIKSIGNIGDIVDHLDIAQLVARHICTRYRSQLICLQTDDRISTDGGNSRTVPKVSSSGCGLFRRKKKQESDQSASNALHETINRLVIFATAFIIREINNETLRISTNPKSSRKDSLSTSFVLTISRACLIPETGFLSSFRRERILVPIDLAAADKMLHESNEIHIEESNSLIEWDLHDFFCAPGIYYYADNDNGKILYYGSYSLMIPNRYGYRLGTREEVDIYKKLNQ